MDTLLRRRSMIAAGGVEPPAPPGPATPVFYDYLIFDGTAYVEIDDITPPTDFSIRVNLGEETVKAAQRLIWVNGDTTGFGAIYGSATTSTNRYFSVYYGASSAVSTDKKLAFSNDSFGFFLTPKRFGYGNTAYTITKGTSTPNGGVFLGTNAAKSGQPYTGRMGVIRIYGSDAQNVTSYADLNNYTSVFTFRPCTYNGEAGIWCEETSTFYGNTAGAGTLSVKNV